MPTGSLAFGDMSSVTCGVKAATTCRWNLFFTVVDESVWTFHLGEKTWTDWIRWALIECQLIPYFGTWHILINICILPGGNLGVQPLHLPQTKCLLSSLRLYCVIRISSIHDLNFVLHSSYSFNNSQGSVCSYNNSVSVVFVSKAFNKLIS